MFSKPLIAAGLVASVNATASLVGLLKESADSGATEIFAQNSCYLCLTTTGGQWFFKASDKTDWQDKVTTGATKTLATDTGPVTAQGFCCKDHTTKLSSAGGATAALCALAVDATDKTKAKTDYAVYAAATGKYSLLVTVTQCPMYQTICGTPVKVGTTAPDIGASGRSATLKKAGDGVTLPISRPDGASGKNWGKEACSYVVKSMCGAPIVTFDTANADAEAASFLIYGTEYTGSALGTDKLAGADSMFLPVAGTTVGAAVTPQAAKADKQPDDELDTVGLAVTLPGGTLAQTDYKRKIPGQALYAWLANVSALYKNYDTTVATYEKERKEWDDGKRGAKPYQPQQPDALPTVLDQLKYTTATVKATRETGQGLISQYEIKWTAVNEKAGKYFGTNAGISTWDGATGIIKTAATQLSNYHWVTNTGKTGTSTDAKTLCDPAYVMITAHLLKNTEAGTTKKLHIVVTEGAWAKTLEESVPSRPVATTAPKESGAAYLSMGAAAALVALSLS